ncbi:MAG: NYN domain-containing protein [Sedimentisphaerales bacterium]|jgi:predicted RNA-binding protein with PIN domain
MPVIIDGHNLLWAIQNPDEDTSITDVAMCQALDIYFGLTHDKAEIVFDGIGPPDKTGFNNISNLEITFSGRDTDCDTIIEHRILDSTAPAHLTIVSTDRRIRDAASARKATSVQSDEFWTIVTKRLSKQKRTKEPAAKRAGLTESETQLWLKTFGLNR